MTPPNSARITVDVTGSDKVLALTLASVTVASSVTPATRRKVRARSLLGRRVLVDPIALADLVDAIEALRPGLLADIDAQAARRRAERRAEQ